MGKIERLYEERIAVEMEEIGKEQPGSDKYRAGVECATKLTDRLIELKKLEAEREKNDREREFDENYKLEQLKADKKDRLIKNCLTAASIGVPVAGAFVMGVMSMNFQRTDSFFTEAGNGAVKSLLKFKI